MSMNPDQTNKNTKNKTKFLLLHFNHTKIALGYIAVDKPGREYCKHICNSLIAKKHGKWCILNKMLIGTFEKARIKIKEMKVSIQMRKGSKYTLQANAVSPMYKSPVTFRMEDIHQHS